MTVTVKNKTPLVVPLAVRRMARFKGGEELELRASGGVITITPKLPSADDEYTPAQRRAIDARLAAARKGPYYGPFETAEEAIKFVRRQVRNRKANKHR